MCDTQENMSLFNFYMTCYSLIRLDPLDEFMEVKIGA